MTIHVYVASDKRDLPIKVTATHNDSQVCLKLTPEQASALARELVECLEMLGK